MASGLSSREADSSQVHVKPKDAAAPCLATSESRYKGRLNGVRIEYANRLLVLNTSSLGDPDY